MTEARLRAEFFVRAQLRLCDQTLLPAVVRHRGDPDAGTVLIKLDRLDGNCVVFTQVRTIDGEIAWMRATGDNPVPDVDGESYINKQLQFDPDIWVLEIEDPGERYKVHGTLI